MLTHKQRMLKVMRGEGGLQVVEYHTPRGMVKTVGGHTEEMRKKGASLGWTREHIIQGPEDYGPVAYIFENMRVYPQYEGAEAYAAELGEEGVVAAGGASLGASPMHHIQKEFFDQTRFFFEYKDNYSKLEALAKSVELYFEKALGVIANSPAEVVLWGANYDETITWPPYFKKEILPWLKKASEALKAQGKIVATHADGENQGLMDLIHDSGVEVAESITPFPMTKVRIEEYYARWKDKITLMGCIPECLLLKETASSEELDQFMDNLFRGCKPGERLILGVADSIPPNADFERLERIAERIEKQGKLPL